MTYKNVLEWVEFLSEDEIIRIHDLAQTQGLGELDFYEWVYMDASLLANHNEEKGVDSLLNYQLHEAITELYQTRSESRAWEIQQFVHGLKQDSQQEIS